MCSSTVSGSKAPKGPIAVLQTRRMPSFSYRAHLDEARARSDGTCTRARRDSKLQPSPGATFPRTHREPWHDESTGNASRPNAEGRLCPSQGRAIPTLAYQGLCVGTRVGASSSLTHPSVGGGKRQPFRERGRERRGTFKLARRPARHGPARSRRARAASGPRGAGAAAELAGHQQPPPPQPAARPGPPLAAPHRAAPLAARGWRPEAFTAAAPGGPAVGSGVGGRCPPGAAPAPARRTQRAAAAAGPLTCGGRRPRRRQGRGLRAAPEPRAGVETGAGGEGGREGGKGASGGRESSGGSGAGRAGADAAAAAEAGRARRVLPPAGPRR